MKPLTIQEVYERVLFEEAKVIATCPNYMTDYAFERIHDIGNGPLTDAEMLVIIGGILGVCLRADYRLEAANIFSLLTHIGVRR